MVWVLACFFLPFFFFCFDLNCDLIFVWCWVADAGPCYQFKEGTCHRGDSCKFSHGSSGGRDRYDDRDRGHSRYDDRDRGSSRYDDRDRGSSRYDDRDRGHSDRRY